jgi:hypothetical protein
MKRLELAFLRRVFVSLIASGSIWFTAVAMDIDARGVSLIRLLSFHPFFYFFLVWPFVVAGANSRVLVFRSVACGTALLYYLIVLLFDAKNFFIGISHFFHDCYRVIRLMGIDGWILLSVWFVAFSAIQYMIWHPFKTAPMKGSVN